MKSLRLLWFSVLLCLPSYVSALTLSDMRTEVRRSVRDTSSITNLRRYSDTVLTTFINEGQRVISYRTGIVTDSSPVVLSSGVNFVAVPTNFINAFRVTWSTATNSTCCEINLPELDLRQLDEDNGNTDWTSSTASTPSNYYMIYSQTARVFVHPIPQTNGYVKMYFYALPADLSSDSDIPFDSSLRLYIYHDLIAYYVIARILTIEGIAEEAAYYTQLYEMGIAEINQKFGRKPQREVKPSKEITP